jgi:hypothetical protein
VNHAHEKSNDVGWIEKCHLVQSFKEINEFLNKKMVIQAFFCMAMHVTSLQSLM